MASKRGLRRKACKGKQAFANEAEAKQALWHLRQRKDTGWMTPYKCRFCHRFHYGHPPKAARQALSQGIS